MSSLRCAPSNRRAFLVDTGLGFAGLALGAMLQRDGYARDVEWSPPTGQPHFAPKAKSVIWIFMNGGVSHMESFDPKPMLNQYADKTIAETPFADAQDPRKLAIERLVVPDANGNQRNKLYPLQVGFRKHGESGIEVSDWFPHIARNVDKLAVVRSMWTTDSNHGAQFNSTRVATRTTAHSRHLERGSITGSDRSTTICRNSSLSEHVHIGTRGTVTTSARRTTRCRYGLIRTIRSSSAGPSGHFRPSREPLAWI